MSRFFKSICLFIKESRNEIFAAYDALLTAKFRDVELSRRTFIDEWLKAHSPITLTFFDKMAFLFALNTSPADFPKEKAVEEIKLAKVKVKKPNGNGIVAWVKILAYNQKSSSSL